MVKNKELKLEDAIQIAIQNNKEFKAYTLKVDEQKALIPSAFSLDKTNFTFGTDQNNIAENNHPLKVWGVSQNFSFPTLYSAEWKAKKIEFNMAQTELKIHNESLIKEVTLNYIELQVLNEKLIICENMDSLYLRILRGATLRNSKGDISNLDLLNMKAKQQQMKNQLNEIKYSIANTYAKLMFLMDYQTPFAVSQEILVVNYTNRNMENTPFVEWLRIKDSLSYSQINIEKNKLLPDISLNYFLGTNFFNNAQFYHGFEAGIAIPLFFSAQKSKIKASKIALNASKYFSEYEVELLKIKQKELLNSYMKLKELIDYYNENGSKLYDEILRTATLSFENGEIDFFKFATSTETALQIKLDYLNNLMNYSNVTLELNYLSK